MTIFTWLLIGHLVGDWMLQNDWMARGKQRHLFTPAILVHCIIYTLTLLTTLWIATGNTTANAISPPPYLTFFLVIFVSHWIIDAGNLANHWVRFWKQSRLLFVRIMVDQTLHVLVLAALMEWWM